MYISSLSYASYPRECEITHGGIDLTCKTNFILTWAVNRSETHGTHYPAKEVMFAGKITQKQLNWFHYNVVEGYEVSGKNLSTFGAELDQGADPFFFSLSSTFLQIFTDSQGVCVCVYVWGGGGGVVVQIWTRRQETCHINAVPSVSSLV